MKTHLEWLVKRLKRKSADAYRMSNRMLKARAFEASKLSLGEYIGYKESARRLEYVLSGGNPKRS
jgi:hypothetical protein